MNPDEIKAVASRFRQELWNGKDLVTKGGRVVGHWTLRETNDREGLGDFPHDSWGRTGEAIESLIDSRVQRGRFP